MSDEIQTEELREWRSALRTAWIDTRRELDRSLLTLSAGGIALLVTLLTAVGVTWSWMAVPYAVAFLGFLVAISAVILVYDRDSEYLERAAADPKAERDPLLRYLDRIARWAFLTDVLAATVVGAASGVGSYLQRVESEMPESNDATKVDTTNIQTGARPVTETRPQEAPFRKSLDGITAFAPPAQPTPTTPFADSDQGGQGGGGNEGGSAGSEPSGESEK